MQTYEFKVKIEAKDNKQANELLQAMFDLMKTTRNQLSAEDFIAFSKKIKANPKLINKAKMFI